MRPACLWLLAFASWPGPLCWSFFVKSWSRSSRVQVRLSATSSDNIKSKSLWSGRKNLNEVFFKEELQRLEQEVAEAEAREKKEASSKLGTAETTTRRVQIRYNTDPVMELEAAVVVEEEESPEAAASTNSSATSASGTRLPFLDVESIGLTGRWVERSGNFILRPSPTREQPPLGVFHFLGGAFVGAAPHLTYRYLLESLADAGYVVVATPYRLDFDYLRSCDTILSKFDAVAVELATEYGPLPVIGLGHSCGALLQVLVTSLFPDAPRAANVLVSFNNRPASQSIPGLEEVIAPLSGMLLSPTPPQPQSQSQSQSQGSPGQGQDLQALGGVVSAVREAVEKSLDSYAQSALAPSFVGREVLPLLRQSMEIVDQIPPLLRDVASGVREFTPSPVDTKEVCRRMYRARRTLLLKFENDDLDESEAIEKVLREANTIMRMRRPMVEMEVQLKVLTGTHITPLTQNVFLDPPQGVPDPLEPVRLRVRGDFLKTVDEVRDAVLGFLAFVPQ